jgi:L-seryl-tRNA(Ser) seleniumtransferase
MKKKRALRSIPAVEKVLQALGPSDLPRPVVVSLVRKELAALRAQTDIPEFDPLLANLQSKLRACRHGRIQPVINATGIVIHTNLGRAPLAAAAMDALNTLGPAYCNLEYDLTSGERGKRAGYLETNLALLCGAEAATAVNNGAAALVLILRHFLKPGKNEVIISRGELVQIGGGFRIPEVLETSGARLREVGTTNRTTSRDYEKALRRETALILKVHRSNFFMDGFVKSPSTEELSTLARKKRIPFVEDLGSGAVLPTETLTGLAHEPTPAEVLKRGVDLVSFSGDKLLGGPQAGIIAGKTRFINALKRQPLYRALRCDKLILGTLQATVDLYLQGKGTTSVPVMNLLRTSQEELKVRAESISRELAGLPVNLRCREENTQVGGGTLPQSQLPSVTLQLQSTRMRLPELSERLRAAATPVIGFISGGWLKLDLRTVFTHQDENLTDTLKRILKNS